MSEKIHQLLALGFNKAGKHPDDARVKHFFVIQLPGEVTCQTIACDIEGLIWKCSQRIDLTELGYTDLTLFADTLLAVLSTKS